jgi:hypothetical protein
MLLPAPIHANHVLTLVLATFKLLVKEAPILV